MRLSRRAQCACHLRYSATSFARFHVQCLAVPRRLLTRLSRSYGRVWYVALRAHVRLCDLKTVFDVRHSIREVYRIRFESTGSEAGTIDKVVIVSKLLPLILDHAQGNTLVASADMISILLPKLFALLVFTLLTLAHPQPNQEKNGNNLAKRDYCNAILFRNTCGFSMDTLNTCTSACWNGLFPSSKDCAVCSLVSLNCDHIPLADYDWIGLPSGLSTGACCYPGGSMAHKALQ